LKNLKPPRGRILQESRSRAKPININFKAGNRWVAPEDRKGVLRPPGFYGTAQNYRMAIKEDKGFTATVRLQPDSAD
jgi:hypothetical protein